eukprot:9476300-Pyramimonas_sp.AAC.1
MVIADLGFIPRKPLRHVPPASLEKAVLNEAHFSGLSPPAVGVLANWSRTWAPWASSAARAARRGAA